MLHRALYDNNGTGSARRLAAPSLPGGHHLNVVLATHSVIYVMGVTTAIATEHAAQGIDALIYNIIIGMRVSGAEPQMRRAMQAA